MASSLVNVCRFNPTAGGNTDWTYSSAVTGYQSPSAAGVVNGATYSYRAESANLSQWEIGTGTYNTGTGVLTRAAVLSNSSGTTAKINFSASPQVAIVALAGDLVTPAMLRGHLSGLVLSTAGSSSTISIAAGVAADSSNADLLTLAAAISKTTAAWAVGGGNGGWDGAGANPASNAAWYSFYLIKRPDTGVVDVIFAQNASAPVLPGGYTLTRRIGSALTNASNQWVLFTQNGDEFLWNPPINNVNALAVGSAATHTVSTPLGIKTNALLSVFITNSAAAVGGIVYSPDLGTQVANTPLGYQDVYSPGAGMYGAAGSTVVRTDTSSQIKTSWTSGTNNSLYITTKGWIDRRGRDA